MIKGMESIPPELSGKEEQLRRLSSSSDAQRLKQLADPDGTLMSSYEKGDMDAVRSALSGALQTEEGARLLKQLQALMK